VLAAMPNAPGVFNPDPSAGADFTALVGRWQYVLGNMYRDNAIPLPQAKALCALGVSNCSQSQAAKAFEKNIKIVPPGQATGASYQFYLLDMVKSELEAKYNFTRNQIDTMGLKITTTFNQSMTKPLAPPTYINEKAMKAGGQKLPSWAHA